MSQKQPLEPKDFPVETVNKAVVKRDGEKIADAKNDETAEAIRDRLNADHHREEEDRWA